MIKRYEFEYGCSSDASATFEVDTEKFTPSMANDVLKFFTWNYSKNADPIDEVMKKYAMTAIRLATMNDYNIHGVTNEFDDCDGYYAVDGSKGITLVYCEPYNLDEDELYWVNA